MKNKPTAAVLAFSLAGSLPTSLPERASQASVVAAAAPVAGVLALIAAIKYLTMSEVEFDRRYNGPSIE